MLDWLQFVLAPQVINGLSIGVAVVLMALGLTIIFGLLDVINMAHGWPRGASTSCGRSPTASPRRAGRRGRWRSTSPTPPACAPAWTNSLPGARRTSW